MPKAPTKTSRVYIGIDPGASGGIAVIGGSTPRAFKMPATKKDLLEALRMYSAFNVVAVYEKVQGYIGEGSEAPGSAMFNFGRNYGHIEMALLAAGIDAEEVPPQVWQKGLGIPPRRKEGRKFVETRTQWKNRLKGIAQQRFPGLKVTLAVSDALLIAKYLQLRYEGGLR